MKIAVFGGSFDPIHIGHLIIAEYIKEEYGIDQVLFVPVGIPSHRQNNLVNARERYKMIELAIKDNDKFQVSDIEIEENNTSYTIDTLKKLEKKYPNDDIYEIIGEDSADYLDKWKDYEELIDITKFFVFRRAGYNYTSKHKNIIVADSPLIEISSTDIRRRIKKGKSVKYLIPENVRVYIEEKGFYL